jgi:ubiquinone/menaquinone biosynthesis C-methylase UbiE
MKTQLYKKILELLNLEKERSYRILDFGCGRGELLDGISKRVGAKSHLVGIDAMKKSITIAKAKHPDIDFQHVKFIDTLNFPDEYFD